MLAAPSQGFSVVRFETHGILFWAGEDRWSYDSRDARLVELRTVAENVRSRLRADSVVPAPAAFRHLMAPVARPRPPVSQRR